MTTELREQKILTGEEIAAALADLGEEVTAERVSQLQTQLARQALPAGADTQAVQQAVDTARREFDAQAAQQTQPYQIVKPGAKTEFDLARPFVLTHYIPYAAAVPGTDMGEQEAGNRYWLRTGGWGWSVREAARFTRTAAERERMELSDGGRRDVRVEDANLLEARLQVVMAVSRVAEKTVSRAEHLARVERVRAIPDAHFARVVDEIAKTGQLSDRVILGAGGLVPTETDKPQAATVSANADPTGKVFLVYHLTDTRPRAEQQLSHNYALLDIGSDPDQAVELLRKPASNGEYRLVAEVRAEGLDDVFQLTNSIDAPWWGNDGVQAKFSGNGCRSTSVGDIVVDSAGVGHFCDRIGWVNVGMVEHPAATPTIDESRLTSRALAEQYTVKGSMPQAVVHQLYALREAEVESLGAQTQIAVADLHVLDRLGRAVVAGSMFEKCDAAARHALLHDEHAHVRSCALLSQAELGAQREVDSRIVSAERAATAAYDGNHVENHCPGCNEYESECSCGEDSASPSPDM
jgi:hypothetical protein